MVDMISKEKIGRKIRYYIVHIFRETRIYPFLHLAYWHMKLHKGSEETEGLFFSARPNPGAGIGHQMANWIAGYWFAKMFGLQFAHIPFSSHAWEEFLGFGCNEKRMSELKKEGYHVVRLPLFDEFNQKEVDRIRAVIRSYSGKKVVFLAEQDQFYKDQYGVMNEIQDKFYGAPARKSDRLIYDNEAFNLAIHVRRGDIVQGEGRENPNLTIRYQKNEYFIAALKTALDYLKDEDNIQIYLFSQGKEEQFQEFQQFPNIHFCLDMGAMDSFLHMVYADALITSKSSFSYKPALLNRGIKFCPKDFWHGYPKLSQWILLNEEGMKEED